MSLFVSFEGGEGSGKSTQARILAERLERSGVKAVLLREPGSTPLGDYLRDWLKSEGRASLPPSAELFLFAAARAVVVRDVIKPALEAAETVVIADRYVDSTTAYQGYGRGIPISDIDVVNRLASQSVMPDLTFLLDCSPADGLGRVSVVRHHTPSGGPRATPRGSRGRAGSERFELEPLDFHERVREGFSTMAEGEPDRWRVIDATKSVEEVSAIVWAGVQRLLGVRRDDDPGGDPALRAHRSTSR